MDERRNPRVSSTPLYALFSSSLANFSSFVFFCLFLLAALVSLSALKLCRLKVLIL